MKEQKYGLTLNYPEGRKHAFIVNRMWCAFNSNGFIGFGSNFHTHESFRLWSSRNRYIPNSIVICRKKLDIDCFVIDDFISENISHLTDDIKDYQISNFTIPIINPNNQEQLSFLEEIDPFKNHSK